MTDRDTWGDRILRVVDHIHEHLDEDLKPEDLAGMAKLSVHHLLGRPATARRSLGRENSARMVSSKPHTPALAYALTRTHQTT